MDEKIAFLTARLDEEERFTYNPALMPVSGPGLSNLVKRARADIAAKRKILALNDDELAEQVGLGDASAAGADLMHQMVIDIMLQPFADHPGFREEWKA